MVFISGVIFGQVQMPSCMLDTPPSLAPIFLQINLGPALRWGIWGAIFSFMFVDLFDSGAGVAAGGRTGLASGFLASIVASVAAGKAG